MHCILQIIISFLMYYEINRIEIRNYIERGHNPQANDNFCYSRRQFANYNE